MRSYRVPWKAYHAAKPVFLDPTPRRSVDNEWIWAELWTRSPKVAARFYEATVGYESSTIQDSDGDFDDFGGFDDFD